MATRQGKYSNQLILSLIGSNLLELKKIRLRLKSNIPIDGGSLTLLLPVTFLTYTGGPSLLRPPPSITFLSTYANLSLNNGRKP